MRAWLSLLLALGILALAYWMFTNYTLFDGAENVAKGRHALLKWAVSVEWSRPVAVSSACSAC